MKASQVDLKQIASQELFSLWLKESLKQNMKLGHRVEEIADFQDDVFVMLRDKLQQKTKADISFTYWVYRMFLEENYGMQSSYKVNPLAVPLKE